MKTLTSILTFLFILSGIIYSQPTKENKLVVAVVVDQMRYDYLQKFYPLFGDGGFKRLMKDGFNCTNVHYNYVPTYTGPGHTSIFTGTTPMMHGIIGNYYYDKATDKVLYCAEDQFVQSVGGSHKAGLFSPKNLTVTTVGDELRISNGFRSKVIGVALKDRGAILSTGRAANAAYWYDDSTGNWITSSFYLTSLPDWAQVYNDQKAVNSFLDSTWNLLYPESAYSMCGPDDMKFEEKLKGTTASVFPYYLSEIRKASTDFSLIKFTPYGNTITTDFAISAIKGEFLGQNEFTDMIVISYSSPDYIGHFFGPQSYEVADNYARLDREIQRLLEFLDQRFGKNYTFVITSDHGVAEIPNYLLQQGIEGGNFTSNDVIKHCNSVLNDLLLKGANPDNGLVKVFINDHIYFDEQKIAENNLKKEDVIVATKKALLAHPSVFDVLTPAELLYFSNPGDPIKHRYYMGYHRTKGGDLLVMSKPGWINRNPVGTTHGAPYVYDTHAPLLWYGYGITKGRTAEFYSITDIAPTLSNILGITQPNATTGRVIEDLFD